MIPIREPLPSATVKCTLPLPFPENIDIIQSRIPCFSCWCHAMGINPCITCGACCACFRTSFYWAESDLVTPDGVPHELTDHLQGHFLVMKGTDSRTPRCIALVGSIGGQVRCRIYGQRPTACRNFTPSREVGTTVNGRCNEARRKWGLALLKIV